LKKTKQVYASLLGLEKGTTVELIKDTSYFTIIGKLEMNTEVLPAGLRGIVTKIRPNKTILVKFSGKKRSYLTLPSHVRVVLEES